MMARIISATAICPRAAAVFCKASHSYLLRAELVAACFLLLLGATLQAQSAPPISLGAPPAYNGDPNTIPMGVAVGDFNGDGILDFAVAEQNIVSAGNDKVAIFIGNADDSFTQQGSVPVEGTIAGIRFGTNHIIATGNFNGPGGLPGIAVALTSSTLCGSGGPGVLFVYVQGGETTSACRATTAAPTSVGVADFNNDGFDDFAISNPSGSANSSITIYMNTASITGGPAEFSDFGNVAVTSINVSGTLYGILAAGNLANPSGLPGGLALLASTGPFTQYVSAIVPANVTAGQGATNFEFLVTQAVSTGTGFSDFQIVALQGANTAAIVGIGSNGMSYLPVTYSLISATPTLGPLTQFSGGSTAGLDLASGGFTTSSVPFFAYLNGSHDLGMLLNPIATTPTVIPVFGPPGDALASGLSANLNSWVVVDAGVFISTNPVTFAQTDEARAFIPYMVDPGTGIPSTAPIFSSTTTSQGILPTFAVGDFNGDGLPDVAVLGENQASFGGDFEPFLNATSSPSIPSFEQQPVVNLGSGSTTLPGLGAQAIVAGSFRTIDPDLALVTSDGVTVFENQGLNGSGQQTFALDPNCQGTFDSGTNCNLSGNENFAGLPSTESYVPPVLAVDVNGDGYQDIVFALPENCNVFNGAPRAAIWVLISNGDGTFKTPVYISSPVANPIGLAYGKLLGSGYNDLVVVNGGEACSSVASGINPDVAAALIPNNHDGTGSFGNAIPIVSNSSPVAAPWISSVAVADMNLDGAPDVVISANDGIHVLLNSMSSLGTFADQGATPIYSQDTALTEAAHIDVADVNQDGFPDVVAAVGGIVYLLPGDGMGQVSSPSQGYASGPNSSQVRAVPLTLGAAPSIFVSNTEGFAVIPNSLGAISGTALAQFNNVTLSFGGITEGSSSTDQVIVTNTGGSALVITNIALANNTGNQFSYQIASCTSTASLAFPLSIPAGGGCTLNIVFAPNTTGMINAQLLFYDNAANSNAPNAFLSGSYIQTIAVGGTGTQAQANTIISVANTPSVVGVGTAIQYNITISNPGPNSATNLVFSHQLESTVQLQSVAASQGSGCTGSKTLGALAMCSLGTLGANSTATIVLDVTPTAAVSLTNLFTFTQDEPDSNSQSASDNVVVLTSLTVTIPTITESIAVSDSPTFADVSDAETISVTDVPLITVTPAPLSISTPVAYFSVSQLGFNTSAPEQVATQYFSLSNLGGSTLNVSSETPPSNPAFTVISTTCTSGATPTALPPNTTCIFAVQYTAPSSPASGTIAFTTNAALSNVCSPPSDVCLAAGSGLYTQTLALSGSGTSTTQTVLPPATVTVPTVIEKIVVTDQVLMNVNVSNQVLVTTGGVKYTRVGTSYTASVALTIQNTSGAEITSPLQLVFVGLSSDTTLNSAAGTFNGNPFLTVADNLAPGQAVSVTATFKTTTPSVTLKQVLVYNGSL